MELDQPRPQPPPTPAPIAAAMPDRSAKPGVGYEPPQGAWKDGLCAYTNQLAPSCK